MPFQSMPYAPHPRSGNTIAELLMRQGAIAGRGAARSGMIWGNAVNQLGQIGAGAVEEHQETSRRNEQAMAFNHALETADWSNPQQAFVQISQAAGPDLAGKVVSAYGSLQKVQAGQKPTLKDAAIQVGALNGMLDAHGPEALAEKWPGYAQALQPFAHLFGVETIPTEFSEELLQTIPQLNAQMNPAEKTPGTRAVTTRRADGTEVTQIVEDKAGQTFESTPAPPKPRVSPEILQAEEAAKARGRESVMGPKREEATRKAAVKGETSLRKEYTKQTKSSVDGIQAIDRFSLKPHEKMQRGENLTPEDQFAMIYAFNKALDPTSVVREGEFRNTRQVGLGVHQEALLLLNKWRKGAQLTQKQAEGMMEVIQGTKETLRAQIRDQDRYFTEMSVAYGFNPERVIGGTAGYTSAAGSGAPAEAPSVVGKKVGKYTIVSVE